jgi:hypothetical protein
VTLDFGAGITYHADADTALRDYCENYAGVDQVEEIMEQYGDQWVIVDEDDLVQAKAASEAAA